MSEAPSVHAKSIALDQARLLLEAVLAAHGDGPQVREWYSKQLRRLHYAETRSPVSTRRYTRSSPVDRFWSKVDKVTWDPCYRWRGAFFASGYGAFQATTERLVRAHRYSYEISVGRIPAELELDHRCFHIWCVRPEHLEAVTHQENMRRYYAHRDGLTVGFGIDWVRGSPQMLEMLMEAKHPVPEVPPG